jgi:flavin-binding protein dodecin
MSVVKVIQLVGQSEESFAAAADEAVKEAARTIRNIKSFEVENLSGEVENGKIAKYRASVHIAFVVDRDGSGGG